MRDLDLGHGVIHVARSLSPGVHGELIEQSPKNHKECGVSQTRALRPDAVDAARGGGGLLFAGSEGGA